MKFEHTEVFNFDGAIRGMAVGCFIAFVMILIFRGW